MAKDTKSTEITTGATGVDTKDTSTLTLGAIDEFPGKRGSAFKLITDSQAQRQNLVNNAILFHWTTTSAYMLTVSLAIGTYYNYYRDLGVLILALGGLSIAFLSLVARLSEDQVTQAEAMQFEDYMGSDTTSKDFKTAVYVYNDLVVAIISATVDEDSGDWKIKGWSVLRRYRHTGLGIDTMDWLINSIKESGAKKFKVGVTTISVEVPAKKLLAKKGFKLVKSTPLPGIRGSIYGLTNDEWVLEIGA